MPSAHFSKIAVLQSLPVGEMQTGKRLSEDVATINLFHDRGLEVNLFNVTTKASFIDCLRQLEEEAKRGVWPLLHLECHGADGKTGIVLADNSYLGWSELKPYFTAINIATRCNLVIVMAACYGGYLGEFILPTDRAPCWAMIGPTDMVFPQELKSGFTAFYSQFLGTLNGDKSLESLQSTRLQSGRYYFAPAGAFFKYVFANYFATYNGPMERHRRTKALSRKIWGMDSVRHPGRIALRRQLREEKPVFEKYLRHFFMIDLYPENAKRFPISYDEVKDFQTALAKRSRNFL